MFDKRRHPAVCPQLWRDARNVGRMDEHQPFGNNEKSLLFDAGLYDVIKQTFNRDSCTNSKNKVTLNRNNIMFCVL